MAKVPEEERVAAINAGTTSGWTALMTAAENGQVRVLLCLSEVINITFKMLKSKYKEESTNEYVKSNMFISYFQLHLVDGYTQGI